MTNPGTISELDLLAYADGLLDHDSERKAQVEAYLASAPAAAGRVDAYLSQTAALRAAYGGRAAEPVPSRLQNTVTSPISVRALRVTGLRAAAVVAISAVAGMAGWYLGQVSEPAPQAAEQRLPSVLREAASNERARWRKLPMPVGGLGRGGALRWENNGVALSLPAPDLSAIGYALTGRRNFSNGEPQAVALSYVGANARNLRLLIAPVSSGEAQTVAVTETGGLRMAYWSQGPLTVALQTDGDALDIAALGRKIRDVIARQAPLPDRQPRKLPPNKVEMTADAAGPQAPERAEQPATHTIIGTDTVIE